MLDRDAMPGELPHGARSCAPKITAGVTAGTQCPALWICVGCHPANALAVRHLAAAFGERTIAFRFAYLIVGRPDRSLSLSGSGHAHGSGKPRAVRRPSIVSEDRRMRRRP
jgi:hypothetical protein